MKTDMVFVKQVMVEQLPVMYRSLTKRPDIHGEMSSLSSNRK